MKKENTKDMEGSFAQNDDIPETKSCCKDKPKELSIKEKEEDIVEKRNPLNILIPLLIVTLVVNVVVMLIFTVTVNNKLTTAVEISKPQEGTLTLIVDQNCTECTDLSIQKKQFLNQNVEILDDTILSSESNGAKELIRSLNITILPALVFTSKDDMKEGIEQGAKEMQARRETAQTLVWEAQQPPFVLASTGEVQGLVTATYITDNNCIECYNVQNIQRPILQRLGLTVVSEEVVDVSSDVGNELLERYNITSVPTVILSQEASAYSSFVQVWGQVGTIEEDENFIFRNLKALGVPFKDLNAGAMVEPPVPETP